MMRTVSLLIPFYGTFFVAFSSSPLNFRDLFDESITSNDSFYNQVVGKRSFVEEAEIEQIKRKICQYLDCDRPKKYPSKNLTGINKTNPTCKVEGTIKSEPSDLTNDTTCMKFKIPAHIAQSSLAINQAELFIHIKKKGKRKTKNSRSSRKNRRITLKISDFNAGNGRGNKIIARVKFRPSETKFYGVALPVYYFTEIKKSSTRSLHLCITCTKCNRKTAITFPLKKKIYRAPRKKLRLKKNRPYLILKAKKPFRKRTKRGKRTESVDCVHQQEIKFSQIGLGRDILRPESFYISTCSRTCISNDVDFPVKQRGKLKKRQSNSHFIRKKDIVVSRNNTHIDIVIKRKNMINTFHSCKPSGYQNRRFDVVMDDSTFSESSVYVKNAKMQRCNCQRTCV